LPLTYIATLTGSLSLMGFPFLTGFYSKDAILELAYSTHSSGSFFAFMLGTTAAFLTSLYSLRLLYLTYYTTPNAFRIFFLQVHEAPFLMSFIMILLCFGSIFIGYLVNDLFIGLGTPFWQKSIFVLPQNAHLEFENIPTFIKLIPVIFAIAGALIGYYFYNTYFHFKHKYKLDNKLVTLFSFFSHKWYFDAIYTFFITKPTLYLGHNVTFETFDRGFFEFFGPLGAVRCVNYFMTIVSKLHSGLLYHYIFTMILGFFLLLTPILLEIYQISLDHLFDRRLLIVCGTLYIMPLPPIRSEDAKPINVKK